MSDRRAHASAGRKQAEELAEAGSSMIVVGNILEKQPELLMEISLAVHQ